MASAPGYSVFPEHRSWLGAVVARIDAGVVGRFVNGTPIGAIDAASIGRPGAIGEGAGDLDPTVLETCDQADKRGQLTEVLILAEDQSKVTMLSL